MNLIRAIICLAMTTVFCLFVSLQFNDVDAPLWIGAYGLAAITCAACVVQSLRRFARRASLALAISCGLWAVVLAGQTSGRWWDGEIEREVGGLVITVLAMIVTNYFSRDASRFS